MTVFLATELSLGVPPCGGDSFDCAVEDVDDDNEPTLDLAEMLESLAPAAGTVNALSSRETGVDLPAVPGPAVVSVSSQDGPCASPRGRPAPPAPSRVPWGVLGLVLLAAALPWWLPLALAAGGGGADPSPTKVLTPAYQASFSPTDQLLKEILDEMRGLRSDLRVALVGGQVKTDAVAVLNQRCARCHQDGKAAGLGDGVILVERDGSVPPFSILEKRRILEQVRTGKMPKTGGPLAPNEKKAVEEFLSGTPARGEQK